MRSIYRLARFSSKAATSASITVTRAFSAESGRLPDDFLTRLLARHPTLQVSTNSYDLESHGRGESHHPTSPPDAVLFPSTVEEVQTILRLCCRESSKTTDGNVSEVDIVSVIPYGAGTSVEGHLNLHTPPDEVREVPSSIFTTDTQEKWRKVRFRRRGGVSIDMRNFDSISDVDSDAFCRVGAGVTRNRLNADLRHTGLQFMIDPGADATLGGMTASGASGTSAVKYSTMKENVLSINAVLPPDTILSANDDEDAGAVSVASVGCAALKNSAGYNLPSLLTTSEGTLGVITDVTVKLYPIPSYVVAASCGFDDLHSAAEAVTLIKMEGIPVSRIELLDEMSILAFNKSLGVDACAVSHEGDDRDLRVEPLTMKPHLFMEFSGHSEVSVREDLSAAQSICVEYHGTNFQSASDEATRQTMWAARHRLYYSSIALRNGATPQSTILTDVCVPLSAFADVIGWVGAEVKENEIVGPCFGHAGDGNFHCILPLTEEDTEEYKAKVWRLIEGLSDRAISCHGTCTGEHGVGSGKKKYLRRMYGEGGLKMMRAIKNSLDPFNIMNPGKIFDPK